jgi:hypothetical protein
LAKDCPPTCFSPPWLAHCVISITPSTTKKYFTQVDIALSPIQSSHSSKRLKIDVPKPMQDKGKETTTHSSSSKESTESVSSRLHLKDDCSHVISVIQTQGSNHSNFSTEKSKGDSSEFLLSSYIMMTKTMKKLVAYMSQSLSDDEIKYFYIEKHYFSLIKAIEKFCHFILGKHM